MVTTCQRAPGRRFCHCRLSQWNRTTQCLPSIRITEHQHVVTVYKLQEEVSCSHMSSVMMKTTVVMAVVPGVLRPTIRAFLNP
eukprot:22712_6